MFKSLMIERICPILEALGAFAVPFAILWYTSVSEQASEHQEKVIRAHEAVQNYLSKISELQEKGLKQDETLQDIARAYTLALLRNPDLQRYRDGEVTDPDFKGQAVEYLSDLALIHTDLEGSQCREGKPPIALARANLQGANLNYVFACYADLENADLRGARLEGANLEGANLRGARLGDTIGLTDSQLSTAKLCGTELPKGITLDGNRDCPNP